MRRAVACFLLAWPLLGQVHRIPAQEQWFPNDPAALKRVLDDAFAQAERRRGRVPPRKKLLAVIAPHAALAFSGAIAAAAYTRLDHPKNVIVLGFSHRRRTEGVLAPRLDAYQTPLGRMRIAADVVRQLGFPRADEAGLCDHSLENQLPFVQRVAPEAGVVPLYVGEMGPDELTSAAKRLVARLRQGDVIVASTDFTHYGAAYGYTPFPNDGLLPRRLRQRFFDAVEEIGTLNPARLDRFLAETHDTMCGFMPVRLLMATLAAWNQDVFLSPEDFAASGELTRDYSTSVSYGALAFYPYSAYGVNETDRRKLIASARATLAKYLETGKKEQVPVPAAERTGELEQRSGVFVTLKKQGELRGCVGELAAREPVWSAVADRTLASATEDPRFPPLAAGEGPVSLEVSLLTPVKKLSAWRDFKLGQGVVLALDGHSATFLPQIAAETGWPRERFLEELSAKAGLPRDAYKEARARIYVYSAHVYREAQPAAGSGRQ